MSNPNPYLFSGASAAPAPKPYGAPALQLSAPLMPQQYVPPVLKPYMTPYMPPMQPQYMTHMPQCYIVPVPVAPPAFASVPAPQVHSKPPASTVQSATGRT